MRVMSSASADLVPEFGILAGRWTQYNDMGDVPFGAMWCVVPPGGRADTDCHDERELVVVVQGTADVHASNRTETVRAGSAALLDGGEAHVLANSSAEEPLVTLSIYWEPAGPGTPATQPDAGAAAEPADAS